MNAPYENAYPVGSSVCIVDRPALETFLQTWHFHDPLQPQQLAFAGRTAQVAGVGYYHGGTTLYTLKELPGVWHEVCLRTAEPAYNQT
jgi:hypothetical protein